MNEAIQITVTSTDGSLTREMVKRVHKCDDERNECTE